MSFIISQASYHFQKLKAFRVKVLNAKSTVMGHNSFILIFQYGVVLFLGVKMDIVRLKKFVVYKAHEVHQEGMEQAQVYERRSFRWLLLIHLDLPGSDLARPVVVACHVGYAK